MFDERLSSKEEYLKFNEEMEEYLKKRRKPLTNKPKREFLNKFKSIFVVERVVKNDNKDLVEEIIVEEKKQNKEKKKFSFLQFIKNLFHKKEVFEEIEESEEEEIAIDLDEDLKEVFNFTNKVIAMLPKRYIERIKGMPEFIKYKEIINRYNERQRKKKEIQV